MSRVEVGMSELIHHLQDNGEMRKALYAVVAKKTGGANAENVRIINDLAGEISDADLGKVVGGGGITLARAWDPGEPNLTGFLRPGAQFDVQLQQAPFAAPR